MTIKIVKQRLEKPDAQKGYIFDGFPRSVEQAKMMEEQGIEYDYVINLVIPEEEIIKRWESEPSIVIPIWSDLDKHPMNNELAFLFVRV